MKVRYSWDGGNHIRSGCSAEVANAVMDEMEEKLGRDVEAQDVLDAARPEKSPLHGLFTWDDSKAAEQFRLSQARCVIRCLRVTPIEPGVSAQPRRVRLAMGRNDERPGGYARAVTLRDDRHKADFVIAEGMRLLAGVRRRVEEIDEVAGFATGMQAGIDQAIAAGEAARQRIQNPKRKVKAK